MGTLPGMGDSGAAASPLVVSAQFPCGSRVPVAGDVFRPDDGPHAGHGVYVRKVIEGEARVLVLVVCARDRERWGFVRYHNEADDPYVKYLGGRLFAFGQG